MDDNNDSDSHSVTSTHSTSSTGKQYKKVQGDAAFVTTPISKAATSKRKPTDEEAKLMTTPKRKKGDGELSNSTNVTPLSSSKRKVAPLSERQQMALALAMSAQESGGSSPQQGQQPSLSVNVTPRSSNLRKVNKRNEKGESPLHIATIRGDVEGMKDLLNAGADVNVQDFAGWTALHEACNLGFVKAAKLLLQNGAIVNAQGLDNDTPLHDAAMNGHHELVALLLENHADPHKANVHGRSPLDVARDESIKKLLRKEETYKLLSDSSDTAASSPASISPKIDEDVQTKQRPKESSNEELADEQEKTKPKPDSLTPAPIVFTNPKTVSKITEETAAEKGSRSSSPHSDVSLKCRASSTGFVKDACEEMLADEAVPSTDKAPASSGKQPGLEAPDSSSDSKLNSQSKDTPPLPLSLTSGSSLPLTVTAPGSLTTTVSTSAKTAIPLPDTKTARQSLDFSPLMVPSKNPTLFTEERRDSSTTVTSFTSMPASTDIKITSEVISTLENESGLNGSSATNTATAATAVDEKSDSETVGTTVDTSGGAKEKSDQTSSATNSLWMKQDSPSRLTTTDSITTTSSESGTEKKEEPMEVEESVSALVPEPVQAIDEADSLKECETDTSSLAEEPPALPFQSITSSDTSSASSSKQVLTEGKNVKDKQSSVGKDSSEKIDSTKKEKKDKKSDQKDASAKSSSRATSPAPEKARRTRTGSMTRKARQTPTQPEPPVPAEAEDSTDSQTSILSSSSTRGNRSRKPAASNNQQQDEDSAPVRETRRKAKDRAHTNSSPSTTSVEKQVKTISPKVPPLTIKLPDHPTSVETEEGAPWSAPPEMKDNKDNKEAVSKESKEKESPNSAPPVAAALVSASTSNSASSTGVTTRGRMLRSQVNRNSGATVPEKFEEHVPPRKSRRMKETPVQPAPPPVTYTPPPPPITIFNPYTLFKDVNDQMSKKWESMTNVQPKAPQGYTDFSIHTKKYLLMKNAGSNASKMAIPLLTPPAQLTQPMKELFTKQEQERYKLRQQHILEGEKLRLAYEQELVRVHTKAARAQANQEAPLSVCTILKDKETASVYHPFNALKESSGMDDKDKLRSHTNQPRWLQDKGTSRSFNRQLRSWIQDTEDKFEKLKDQMISRHHHEAESLYAVQLMNWEFKLKECGLCDSNTQPTIDSLHVPLVVVNDEADILNAYN